MWSLSLQQWMGGKNVSKKWLQLVLNNPMLLFILLHRCECNLQDYTSTKELDNECKETIKNGNETELGSMCSDRGECFCGSCYCNSNYAGKYCQCDKCPM